VNCPSCNTANEENEFCIRCGFGLAARGVLTARIRGDVSWVLRRTLSGMVTGFVGWCVLSLSGRFVGGGLGQWGHLFLAGAIGGIFLGSVEGMIEESTLKTVRGGFFGALGGMAGGIAGGLTMGLSHPGMTGVVAAWSVTGMVIGASSVWMERRVSRVAIATIAGGLGGGLGGFLGYQMYAGLADVVGANTWRIKLLIESSPGAILGAIFWCILGFAEKQWIFRRRVANNISYKECERCHHANIFKAWYCAACGALLQVAAPPDKLPLPKRQALARVVAALQYLGRLSSTTATVVAVVTAFGLGVVNPFLGLFGLLSIVLLGYLLYTFFTAFAELFPPVN